MDGESEQEIEEDITAVSGDKDDDIYTDAYSLQCVAPDDDSCIAPPLPPRRCNQLPSIEFGIKQCDISESLVQLENNDVVELNKECTVMRQHTRHENNSISSKADADDNHLKAPPLPPRSYHMQSVHIDNIRKDNSVNVLNTIDTQYDLVSKNHEAKTETRHALSYSGNENENDPLNEAETIYVISSKSQKNISFDKGIFHHIESRDEVTLNECIVRGADVNFENKDANSLCPLHFAAKLDSVECLMVLIEHKAKIEKKEKRRGDTPLHIAAQYGSYSCIEALLKEDAFVDSWNRDHWTPLHVAAFYGNDKCVEALLEANANVEAKTLENGSSPLHLAAQENCVNCLHILLEHGADVEARMKSMYFTPLHLAAKAGHLNSVRILMKYGANRSSKIRTGMTALDFADLHGHEQVAQLLQNADLGQMDLLENGLPKEIRVMDNQSANRLQDLLKDGWFRVYEVRYMIVGEFGVGKTTLAKTLIGEKISPARQATESIDLYVGKACINVEDGTWCCQDELLSPEDTAFHRLLMHTQSTETIQATYKRQLSERTRTIRQTRKTYAARSQFVGSLNEPYILQDLHNAPKSEIKYRNTMTGLKEAAAKFIAILSPTKETQLQESNVEIKINKDRLLRKTVKACKRHLHKGNKAPVFVWDFGGQDVFYTTHQTFLTYRGIYIIVFDGSRDLDDLAPGTESLPGCSGRLTTRRYLRFWVNSILTYSKWSFNGFPKIMVIASHCDKVPEEKRQEVKEKIFHDIHEEFKNQDAINHLVLHHKLFIDTRNLTEQKLLEIKTILVDIAMNQPYWGERMPKRFIHLEMELLSVQRSRNILTMKELISINLQNPLGPLDEDDLEMFLHLQHAMGRMIYFPVPGLNEHIILNPVFLIDAFRSIITDKTFCENDSKRQDLWKNMHEHGVLKKKDIDSLWSLAKYSKFNKHRTFLTSLMVHLDFIAEPRLYISGCLVESEIYLVPCMISNISIICWPPQDFETRAITFSFHFQRSFLPPAIANRFLTACVSLWTVHHEGGQTLLSSGFSVVNIDRSHLLAIQCNESRIIVSLVHCTSKYLISPSLAGSLKDSLNDILENICDVYANAFEDGSKERGNIVYSIDIGCCEASPCFSSISFLMNLKINGTEKWTCREHQKGQQVSLILRWFPEKELKPCENCKGIDSDLLSLELTDVHLCKLSTQFSIYELQELLFHLEMSVQEWRDLEYLELNPEIMKIRALLMLKNKRGQLTFGDLKEIMCAAEFNEHKLCVMTRTKTLGKEIDKSALVKIPTDQDLDDVVAHVGAKSLHIAIHLGLSMNEWEDLKTANPKSLVQLNRSVLSLWHGRSRAKPTLQMLAEALLMIDVSPDFLFK